MIAIIKKVDVLDDTTCFNRKNAGTPMDAAQPKQISCLLVRLKKTLLFTFVRSLGTAIYDAAILFLSPFAICLVLSAILSFGLRAFDHSLVGMQNRFRNGSRLEQGKC